MHLFPAASEPVENACLTRATKSFSMRCSESLEFCSGSDAWAVLLRVWWISLQKCFQGVFAFCGVPDPPGI